MALAVRKSASWLMLDTSGELFMMTRMRDSGNDTSRFSPPLNLVAILPPRSGRGLSPLIPARNGRPPQHGPLGAVVRSLQKAPRAAGGRKRRDYNSREAARRPSGGRTTSPVVRRARPLPALCCGVAAPMRRGADPPRRSRPGAGTRALGTRFLWQIGSS